MNDKEVFELVGIGRWTYEWEARQYEFIGVDGTYEILNDLPLLNGNLNLIESWSNQEVEFGLAIHSYGKDLYKLTKSGIVSSFVKVERSDIETTNFSHESFVTFADCVVLVYDFGAVGISYSGEHIWTFRHERLVCPRNIDSSSNMLSFYEVPIYNNPIDTLVLSIKTGTLINNTN